MTDSKKYQIISTIEDDAPFGDINWCTISFLTPQKIEHLKWFDVRGFKVHTGQNTVELAQDDMKRIKESKKDHDVFLAQMGKIHAWDDTTKAEEIKYNNNKLNDMEKARRENLDKLKLLGENFKNELQSANHDRKIQQVRRMQQKLYEKGLISQKELELVREEQKKPREVKEEITQREKVELELEETFKTDYLDENEPIPLKYGLISIYSPKQIAGLKILCFKIRGMFQTIVQLQQRMKDLASLYPHDRIYQFEVGKWCAYSEKEIDDAKKIKYLNYAMKCYLENLKIEREEFEKRKQELQTTTEQESKLQKIKNKHEKRKDKRKEKVAMPHLDKDDKIDKDNKNRGEIKSLNQEDEDAIKKIINYLDDPELRNKYVAASGERMEVLVNEK